MKRRLEALETGSTGSTGSEWVTPVEVLVLTKSVERYCLLPRGASGNAARRPRDRRR
jgi:hypothetical protein